MAKSKDFSTHTTYILRCWQEGTACRYSLEEVGSGERHGFASLDDFVAFMLARSTQVGGAQKGGVVEQNRHSDERSDEESLKPQ